MLGWLDQPDAAGVLSALPCNRGEARQRCAAELIDQLPPALPRHEHVPGAARSSPVTAAMSVGVVIGVLLGLLGGGGSILAVPALVYGAGIPLSAAVPTSLLIVGTSAATAAVPRLGSGEVQWRIAGVFGAAGAAAAFAGAAVNRLLAPRLVLLGFAALMVGAGVRMLREQATAGGDCAPPRGGVNWRAPGSPPTPATPTSTTASPRCSPSPPSSAHSSRGG